MFYLVSITWSYVYCRFLILSHLQSFYWVTPKRSLNLLFITYTLILSLSYAMLITVMGMNKWNVYSTLRVLKNQNTKIVYLWGKTTNVQTALSTWLENPWMSSPWMHWLNHCNQRDRLAYHWPTDGLTLAVFHHCYYQGTGSHQIHQHHWHGRQDSHCQNRQTLQI